MFELTNRVAVRRLVGWCQEEEATQERLKQLVGIREDYEALKGRLETLADQTSHEIMVPFTKVAYFPGKLKHTNEITCLLGDNWFVERSAKQATEIINRRLQSICLLFTIVVFHSLTNFFF